MQCGAEAAKQAGCGEHGVVTERLLSWKKPGMMPGGGSGDARDTEGFGRKEWIMK
ncbi:hypothetical protein BRYFOR_09786 [Marvinbryantia formatexigens DSM 14469]|uniref:Uncharacterized protein n=1 Tax=Marvinbryantia formatexigens DSM 14469 TaxID=478749 RepID=C6LM87_9FIRM|nr:hypothetical protein BRYFOR_09786 [Marvinbryantia formatexigens DSM 14469]